MSFCLSRPVQPVNIRPWMIHSRPSPRKRLQYKSRTDTPRRPQLHIRSLRHHRSIVSHKRLKPSLPAEQSTNHLRSQTPMTSIRQFLPTQHANVVDAMPLPKILTGQLAMTRNVCTIQVSLFSMRARKVGHVARSECWNSMSS